MVIVGVCVIVGCSVMYVIVGVCQFLYGGAGGICGRVFPCRVVGVVIAGGDYLSRKAEEVF